PLTSFSRDWSSDVCSSELSAPITEDRYTGWPAPASLLTKSLHPAAFQLVSPYQPAGDQPQAIEKLVEGFENGLARQTLLGVTGGSGEPRVGGRRRARRRAA